MIVVTRLNDSQFAINPDLIERIHETPDTTLVMVDGAKFIVTETMAEVIDLVARYRSRIVALAYDDQPVAQPVARQAAQPVARPVAQAAATRSSATRPALGLVTAGAFEQNGGR
ncbi:MULTISPECIES: flagellar FlbD family protein [unclassified Frondihabitans]|uniref:flagellar FlbD family protein n=1 Tax=unclassified Frondihabitans TaxID=2626248 RepID=UPI000F4D37B4|nr:MULTISPECIES: flagellar FlbD family protein [unclassified Frondihabitans]RPE77505.1 flagellar protein FlbD [Frondihabitans sp. PhB153]RPF07782.1 flagellar protein FlbD [Frondihabitans sp. PhB161]